MPSSGRRWRIASASAATLQTAHQSSPQQQQPKFHLLQMVSCRTGLALLKGNACRAQPFPIQSSPSTLLPPSNGSPVLSPSAIFLQIPKLRQLQQLVQLARCSTLTYLQLSEL